MRSLRDDNDMLRQYSKRLETQLEDAGLVAGGLKRAGRKKTMGGMMKKMSMKRGACLRVFPVILEGSEGIPL